MSGLSNNFTAGGAVYKQQLCRIKDSFIIDRTLYVVPLNSSSMRGHDGRIFYILDFKTRNLHKVDDLWDCGYTDEPDSAMFIQVNVDVVMYDGTRIHIKDNNLNAHGYHEIDCARQKDDTVQRYLEALNTICDILRSY